MAPKRSQNATKAQRTRPPHVPEKDANGKTHLQVTRDGFWNALETVMKPVYDSDDSMCTCTNELHKSHYKDHVKEFFHLLQSSTNEFIDKKISNQDTRDGAFRNLIPVIGEFIACMLKNVKPTMEAPKQHAADPKGFEDPLEKQGDPVAESAAEVNECVERHNCLIDGLMDRIKSLCPLYHDTMDEEDDTMGDGERVGTTPLLDLFNSYMKHLEDADSLYSPYRPGSSDDESDDYFALVSNDPSYLWMETVEQRKQREAFMKGRHKGKVDDIEINSTSGTVDENLEPYTSFSLASLATIVMKSSEPNWTESLADAWNIIEKQVDWT